jgi:DNA-binding HxlR family transcriptional regulator
MKRYEQHCPVARAAELITESWTLLVVRELLRGARSAEEISRCVPAMSPGVLSVRLNRLQRARLVVKVMPAGKPPTYRLTEAGLELRPIIDQLGTWGQRWLSPPRGSELSSALLITDIISEMDTTSLPEQPVCLEIVFTDTVPPRNWWLVLAQNKVDAHITDPGRRAAVKITGTLSALTDIWLGNATWLQAAQRSLVQLHGPQSMVRSTIAWLGRSRFAKVPRMRASLPRA